MLKRCRSAVRYNVRWARQLARPSINNVSHAQEMGLVECPDRPCAWAHLLGMAIVSCRKLLC